MTIQEEIEQIRKQRATLWVQCSMTHNYKEYQELLYLEHTLTQLLPKPIGDIQSSPTDTIDFDNTSRDTTI